jgi:hypothetical protein
MTAQNDLDRRIGAWFGAEAAPAPAPEPLFRILETTRGRRPRPALLADIGSHWVNEAATIGVRGGAANLRPALIIVLVALLALALAGTALLVGGRLLAPKPLARHTYLNEFVGAPDLPTPMFGPVLVQLVDGRVLVIGSGGRRPTAIAVLYDVRTGDSVNAGPMVSADSLVVSAAVLLRDGRVLVVGDSRPIEVPFFAVAQVFDPTTMQFEPTGPMVTPRAGAGLALLPDGRVLMTGGTTAVDLDTTAAELFDPAASTFSATGSMRTLRASPMTTLPDGRVFMVGGLTPTSEGGSQVATAEIYDPRTGAFGAAGTMPLLGWVTGVDDAIAMPDGRVAVLGGSSLGMRSHASVWDLTSQTFSARFDGPEWVFGATLLADGRILMTGDRRRANWAGIYDPTTGAVREIRPPEAWRPSSIRLADGRVLLVGGLVDGELHDGSGEPAVSTVQIYQ